MVKGSDIILILVAIIFPPAAAAMIAGCGCDLLINILLTLLGFLPGHIHAFWLIFKRMKAEESFGTHGYTYLGNGNFVGNGGGMPVAPGGGVQQPYYGSTR